MPLSVRPSVCLSVPPGLGVISVISLGQLGAQRLGHITRAVRTEDPSAHGRRSAAIGGNISSRRAITCLFNDSIQTIELSQNIPDRSLPNVHGW